MSLILSGTDGLSDVDGTAATPAIRGTDANTGIFFPAADTIGFSEGGAECARFDSSGNFLLGATSTDSGAKTRVVFGTSQNGIQIKDSNDTSGASFLIFQNGSNSNFATISRDGTNNSLSIGTVSAITFPATQVASAGANTLDDYEEGTWTPTMTNVTTYNTSNTSGRYIKIGKLVFINGNIDASAYNNLTSANVYIGNFPFTIDNYSEVYPQGVVFQVFGFNQANANIVMQCTKNNTEAALYTVAPSTGQNYTNINSQTIGGTAIFEFSVVYVAST